MCCNNNHHSHDRDHDDCHDHEDHVHEIEGFVQVAGNRCDLHSHCFEAVTSEEIPCGKCNHFHEVQFKTDINDCHCHTFCGRTGPAIQAGNGEHIHLLESVTSFNDGHRHCIFVATETECLKRC